MTAAFANASRSAQSFCAASSCPSTKNCIIMMMDAGLVLLASFIIFLMLKMKNRKNAPIGAASPAFVPAPGRE